MTESTREFKIAIVAPVHIQPSEAWVQALEAITKGKNNVHVIIVDDSDGKVELPASWDVYGYDAQERAMGSELYARFKQCQKSSASKNFGHWLAWKEGADIIIGLDSDCIVPPNFIAQHLEGLLMRSTGWTNPLAGTGWFSRGFPYIERDRPTIAHLGLWENELDLYGIDRLAQGTPPKRPAISGQHVADGFIPFSGMNWAIWADAVPGLLFLPNFAYKHGERDFVFKRHDDIWGGYIFQKLMANRGDRIVYGEPFVFHDTVVDAQADADEEIPMVTFEVPFYQAVDQICATLEYGPYEDMFREFAAKVFLDWKGTEWETLVDIITLWAELFEQTKREI